MNRTWPLVILTLSFIVLALLKVNERRLLTPFYRSEKILKLQNFHKARNYVAKQDQELLELWESILTGRSAPVSKIIKDNYKSLGLSHIFTPSGFHLSAVLFPFMKLLKTSKLQLMALMIIGIGLTLLPGFSALKRMVMIKGSQKIWGLQAGFISALIIDILFGTFQENTLSFTYSFLFLGIIYAGFEGLLLVLMFYLGQMMIAYFQGNDISLLLLLFSPFLNLVFTAVMPVLFLLSFPLWEWQVHTGIFLLKSVQTVVDICAEIVLHFPTMEITLLTLVMFIFLLKGRWKLFLLGVFIFTGTLNPDTARHPGMPRLELVPKGRPVKTIYSEKFVNVYFSDGKCRMKLVRGYWYENCSPLRRSSQIRSIKKLSYL